MTEDEWAKAEAKRLRKKVADCKVCEEDGWTAPKDYADGSTSTGRRCPYGCADHLEEAARLERGRW